MIKGRYVEHQIDLIAEKDSRKIMVEIKQHVNPHRFCGLDVILQVQARLEDIQDGFLKGKNDYNFDGRAWVITNAKFSEHAKLYAEGKGIRLTGWRCNGQSLENIIKEKNLFPITILDMKNEDLKAFLDKGIITTSQISRIKIPSSITNQIKIIEAGVAESG